MQQVTATIAFWFEVAMIFIYNGLEFEVVEIAVEETPERTVICIEGEVVDG